MQQMTKKMRTRIIRFSLTFKLNKLKIPLISNIPILKLEQKTAMETCFFSPSFIVHVTSKQQDSRQGQINMDQVNGGWHLETGGLELRRDELQSRPSHHAANVIMLPGMVPESSKVENRCHFEIQSFHICAVLKSAALRKLQLLMDIQATSKQTASSQQTLRAG